MRNIEFKLLSGYIGAREEGITRDEVHKEY